MKIIGLTGSIASGKSTIAGMFWGFGIDVHDADKTVHQLLSVSGAATPLVAARFGKQLITVDGSIDRPALAKKIFGDHQARLELEGILHPLVYQARYNFLPKCTGPKNLLRLWMCRYYLKQAAMRAAIIW